MKIMGIFLISVFFTASCRLNSRSVKDSDSLKDSGVSEECKKWCTSVKVSSSSPLASTVIPGDIRCFNMRQKARVEGKKRGFCYDTPLFQEIKTKTNRKTGKYSYGPEEEAIDPDPEQCQALIDEAQRKCKKLYPHPDPKYVDQTASESDFSGGQDTFTNKNCILINEVVYCPTSNTPAHVNKKPPGCICSKP